MCAAASRYIGAVDSQRPVTGCILPRREAVPRRRNVRAKIFWSLGALLAMVAVLGTSALAGQEASVTRVDARAVFAKGQAALQSGDLDAAEKNFRQVLAADPNSAGAYANLGVVEMRRKEWEQALALLRKAEKLNPKMAGIRLNIGLVEYHRANYAGAIAPLTSVVDEQPGNAQARYLLGLCEVFTQRYAEAVATLEPLWEQRSADLMYLYVLGIAAHNAEHTAANNALDERALQRLIEVGGDSAELHFILGKAYLNRQEDDAAITELNRAAAANESDRSAVLDAVACAAVAKAVDCSATGQFDDGSAVAKCN